MTTVEKTKMCPVVKLVLKATFTAVTVGADMLIARSAGIRFGRNPRRNLVRGKEHMDYVDKNELCGFYVNAVQSEFQVPAEIDDTEYIVWTDPVLNEQVSLTCYEYDTSFISVSVVVFSDPTNSVARANLLEACNTANHELSCGKDLALLVVSPTYSVVRAKVASLVALDIEYVKAVLSRAVTSLRVAADELEKALQN